MTRFPEKVSLPRNGIGSQWLSDPPLGMAVTIRACHMHRCSGPQKIPVQDFYGGNNFRESEWPTLGNGGKTVKVAMHKHKIHITVTNPPGNGGNRTPGHLHKLMAHPGQRCHVWCRKCGLSAIVDISEHSRHCKLPGRGAMSGVANVSPCYSTMVKNCKLGEVGL